jgi:hypothetical protein
MWNYGRFSMRCGGILRVRWSEWAGVKKVKKSYCRYLRRKSRHFRESLATRASGAVAGFCIKGDGNAGGDIFGVKIVNGRTYKRENREKG